MRAPYHPSTSQVISQRAKSQAKQTSWAKHHGPNIKVRKLKAAHERPLPIASGNTTIGDWGIGPLAQ